MTKNQPQLYLTEAERSQAAHIWRADALPDQRPLRLLVGCAAGLSDKTWPAADFGVALGKVANSLAQASGTDIVIVGGAADETRAAEVIEHSGYHASIRSLVGQTSLRTTFSLAEQADVVLTNSSMLLHVAAAFRRPTVVVLGGTLADSKAHDAGWGYPPPYCSVGPVDTSPSSSADSWPTVDRVVEAVLDKARQCDAVRREADRSTVWEAASSSYARKTA